MANYYEILGIKFNASQDEIKRAYRGKAKQYHPDISHDDGKKFKAIDEAYQVLRNPQKRKEYDKKIGYRKQARHRNYASGERMPCSACGGSGRINDSFFIVHYSRCECCKGSSLEPVPVDLPLGREYCPKCGGFGRIRSELISNYYDCCNFCERSGLKPIPVEIPIGRKACRKCNGYGKTWSNDFDMWNNCNFCERSGLDPVPVKVPNGWRWCKKCNGYTKRWSRSFDMWQKCNHCRGTGIT